MLGDVVSNERPARVHKRMYVGIARRDLAWIGLLALTLVLGVVRDRKLKAELRELEDRLRRARASAMHARKTALVTTPNLSGRQHLLVPRMWPKQSQVRCPDSIVRFSIDGDRCVLPFRFEGITYSDCAALTLPSAGGDTVGRDTSVAKWCPVSGGDKVHGRAMEATISQMRRCQTELHRVALIRNTVHGIWARIGRSKIGGVGVIAVHDIPSGQDPFLLPDGKSCGIGEYVSISKDDIAGGGEGNDARLLHG